MRLHPLVLLPLLALGDPSVEKNPVPARDCRPNNFDGDDGCMMDDAPDPVQLIKDNTKVNAGPPGATGCTTNPSMLKSGEDIPTYLYAEPFTKGSYMKDCGDIVAPHVPHIYRQQDGSFKLYVEHPQIKVHYLDYLWVEDEEGNTLWWTQFPMPSSTDGMPTPMPTKPNFEMEEATLGFDGNPPVWAVFELPAETIGDAVYLRPFEHCNIHGTWAGDPVVVGDLPLEDMMYNNTMVDITTNAINLDDKDDTMYFGKEIPFGPTTYASMAYEEADHDDERTLINAHTPYLTLDDNGTVFYHVDHPRSRTHWQEYLWIEDQDGNIVWEVADSQPSHGTDENQMPNYEYKIDLDWGTFTELTPFADCNLHGLWQGDTLQFGPPPMFSDRMMNQWFDQGTCQINENSTDTDTYGYPDVFTEDFNACEADQDTIDGLVQHHVPEVRLNYDGRYIYYLNHPQTDKHFIDWVSVVNENGEYVWWMNMPQPGVDDDNGNWTLPMEFVFEVEGQHKMLKPYENCNLHGLWSWDSSLDVGSPNTQMYLKRNEMFNMDGDHCEIYDDKNPDTPPKSQTQWGKAQPLTREDTSEVCGNGLADYHVPFLTKNLDGSYTMAVPHPQETDHHIDFVWVEDEDKQVVWWREFAPPDESVSVRDDDWAPGVSTFWWNSTFHIPEKDADGNKIVVKGKLTPYEECNKHGLWVGAAAAAPDNGGGGDSDSSDGSSSLSTGQVVAIILGGIVLLCVVYFVQNHLRSKKKSKENEDYHLMTPEQGSKIVS